MSTTTDTQCSWPSGIHSMRDGACTRCGAIDSQQLVGRQYQMRCTDQTGVVGVHTVTVDRVTVSGGVEYAHMDRPRGDASRPSVHGTRMNTYVAALLLGKAMA